MAKHEKKALVLIAQYGYNWQQYIIYLKITRREDKGFQHKEILICIVLVIPHCILLNYQAVPHNFYMSIKIEKWLTNMFINQKISQFLLSFFLQS
jgi:hypothetical protein